MKARGGSSLGRLGTLAAVATALEGLSTTSIRVRTGGHTIRLERLRGRSMSAELDRLPAGVLELRAGVGGHKVAGLDSLEPVFLEELRVLCLQQSPGYSAGPEVDV